MSPPLKMTNPIQAQALMNKQIITPLLQFIYLLFIIYYVIYYYLLLFIN